MPEDGFLLAIRDAPDDEGVRLIYADWLEEHGQLSRADFLRLECDLRRRNSGEPGYADVLERWLEEQSRVPAEWLDNLDVRVNGLPLPRLLVDLLADGRWASPDFAAVLQLFPEEREFCPYALPVMQSETLGYQGQASRMWLGTADPRRPPGDLVPRLAVLIADFGIGADRPIALDYRVSLGQPRVVVLCWSAYDPAIPWGDDNRWVEAAPSFQAFAELIGLQ
ncbi:MAG TPA: TIGR02996 domain-containing protein [Gemmataceae bacterium]